MQNSSSPMRFLFPLMLITGVTLGLLLPKVAVFLKPYTLLMIALLVFFPGLRINWLDVYQVLRRRPLLVLVSLLIIFVGVALIPWVLSWLFPVDRVVVVGFILTAAAPSLLSGPLVTGMIEGDDSIAWSLTILSTLISPLTISFGAHWLVGPAMKVSLFSLMQTVALALILPLALATLIQLYAPRLNTRLLKVNEFGSSLAIVLINLVMIGLNRNVFFQSDWLPLLYMLLASFLIDLGVFFTTRWLTDRAFGSPVSKALALSYGMKNVGLVGGALVSQDARLAIGAGVISIFHAIMFILISTRRNRL